MVKIILLLIGLFLIFCLSSCGTSSSLNGSYAAILPTTTNSSSVTNTSTSSLKSEKNAITASNSVVPENPIISSPTKVITDANTGLIQITTSPNGKMFVTTGTFASGVSRLWTIDGQLVATLSSTPDADYKNSPTASAVPNSAGWSPDSEILATSADSKEIQIWDANGKLRKTLVGHSDKVSSLAWSPNGQYLASGGADKNVIVWDKNGNKLFVLQGHTGPLSKVMWSPDGNLIATIAAQYISGSQVVNDNTLWLWNVTGQLVNKIINQHSKLGYSNISWSPDGKILAAGFGDGSITLYNPDGSKIKASPLGGEEVGPMEWSPNGELLAIGNDTKVYLLDKNISLVANVAVHDNIVSSVSWSHDGNLLASSDASGTVVLWSNSGEKLKILKNNNFLLPIVSLNWADNDKTLICGYHNGNIVFWK